MTRPTPPREDGLNLPLFFLAIVVGALLFGGLWSTLLLAVL